MVVGGLTLRLKVFYFILFRFVLFGYSQRTQVG